MARRGGGEGGSGGGMMAPVLSIATGLLVFVVLEIFAPTIAGSIESAQPALSATSDWNITHNTDLPNGVEEWTNNIRILGVIILIISISVGMYYLKNMA
jgi:ABC-type Na+ efflux pump permease subunit